MKRDFNLNELIGGMAKPSSAQGNAVVAQPTMKETKIVSDEKIVKAMTWQVDVTVLDRLHAYAKANGAKKNAVVERAISEFLEKSGY